MSIEIVFAYRIDSDLNIWHVAFDLNMISTLIKFIVQLTLLLKKFKFIVQFTITWLYLNIIHLK